jgi:DNA-binding NtrC family response regulator
MRQLAQQLEELAGTPLTLVLSGETGTGKTHWARWIHGRSPRAAGPLVEVSPGTSPCGDGGDLLGEVADAEEPGPFEASDGGTLLVEEVPELTRADQLALLRFLIERSDARGSPVDARVVVTTRRGLARETAAGRLHPELAARLSAVELRLPPLRERPGDLRHFARELAARIARAANATPFALDERAFEALERLALPGNLHELQNLIERWTLLGLPADAARSGPHAAASWAGEALDLRVLERRAIARALELSQGNRALAARALGVHARTLRNKLRERSEPR